MQLAFLPFDLALVFFQKTTRGPQKCVYGPHHTNQLGGRIGIYSASKFGQVAAEVFNGTRTRISTRSSSNYRSSLNLAHR
jgi:hypothetical protein